MRVRDCRFQAWGKRTAGKLISFDPRVMQFSAKNVEGGSAEGFDSKPLVVNIDNIAGQMTIGSFQVGAQPSGRAAVARLKVIRSSAHNARFGIRVDEITDIAGKSLVGMVRMKCYIFKPD